MKIFLDSEINDKEKVLKDLENFTITNCESIYVSMVGKEKLKYKIDFHSQKGVYDFIFKNQPICLSIKLGGEELREISFQKEVRRYDINLF